MAGSEVSESSITQAQQRANKTALIYQKLLSKVYSEAPDSTKFSRDLKCPAVRLGASSVRGWRRSQEDAYDVALLPDHFVFAGIFDGHGGRAVSTFCSEQLRPVFLMAQDSKSQPKLSTSNALKVAFQGIDDALSEAAAIRKLADASAEDVVCMEEVVPAKRVPTLDLVGAAGIGAVILAVTLGMRRAMKQRVFMDRLQMMAGAVAMLFSTVVAASVLRPGWVRASLLGCSHCVDGVDGDANSAAIQAAGKVDAERCGATALCAILQWIPSAHHGTVTVANAGDCRCVISRHISGSQESSIVVEPLSEDHKPTLKAEKRRILLADSEIGTVDRSGRVNGELDFSRAIGDLKYKKQPDLAKDKQVIISVPDIQEANLQPGDLLLLASDGVWDVVSNEDAARFILNARSRLGPKAQTSMLCEALLDHCLSCSERAKKGSDNMTCIVIEC